MTNPNESYETDHEIASRITVGPIRALISDVRAAMKSNPAAADVVIGVVERTIDDLKRELKQHEADGGELVRTGNTARGMIRKPKIEPSAVVARRFRVRASWLRQEAEEGNLPAVRAGDDYLFDPEIVEAILLERAQSATVTATT